MNLPALENRTQLTAMLDAFYAKVRTDPLIGPIFNEVAQVNWEEHLPKIYDFWDNLLFGAQNYRGRPFPPHIPLELKEEHFQRWLKLFFETVDETHEGLKAEEIKARAQNIGHVFRAKLAALERFEG
jgi:hemoglobin